MYLRLFSDDPPGWQDVVGWAAETAVTTVAGLIIGLLFFPVKWLVSWRVRRRQDNVTRYREAHNLLRAAQLDEKFPANDLVENEEAEAKAERAQRIAVRRAWDEAVHVLAGGTDAKTAAVIDRLYELYVRAPVVPHVWGPEEADDPRPDLLDLAIKSLTHRIAHHYRALPVSDERITQIGSLIDDAEKELEARDEIERELYVAWREERRAAMRAAQGDSSPEPSSN